SGRRRTLGARERMVTRVGVDEDRAGLAANLRVVRVLDPGEPFVVDADPPEQMGGELLVRIEALALFGEAEAVEIQIGDPLRLLRRYLPADVRERLALPETLGERLAISRVAVTERVAQLLRDVGGMIDLGRNRVDGVGVDARGEHAAAAIENVAALGRRRLRALLLPLGARDEIGAVVDLQIDELCLDPRYPDREEPRDDEQTAPQRRAPV